MPVEKHGVDVRIELHVRGRTLVSRFYGKHSGAVVALQAGRQDELDFETRSRLSTTDVANVLEKMRDKMFAYLRRRKMLAVGADDTHEMTPLAASAVAGTSPAAGPEWRRGTLPVTHQAMKRGRPLCVALDGFTLHAATRPRATGAMDDAGREALLEYILRPSVAQERVTRAHRIEEGVRGRHCRRRLGPAPAPQSARGVRASTKVPYRALLGSPRFGTSQDDKPARRGPYRPWAELLRRTFGLYVLQCPK